MASVFPDPPQCPMPTGQKAPTVAHVTLGALGPSEMGLDHAVRDLTGVGQRLRHSGRGGTQGPAVCPDTLVWSGCGSRSQSHVLLQVCVCRVGGAPNLPKTTVRFLQFFRVLKQCAAETTQAASSRVPPHSSAPSTVRIAWTGTTQRSCPHHASPGTRLPSEWQPQRARGHLRRA